MMWRNQYEQKVRMLEKKLEEVGDMYIRSQKEVSRLESRLQEQEVRYQSEILELKSDLHSQERNMETDRWMLETMLETQEMDYHELYFSLREKMDEKNDTLFLAAQEECDIDIGARYSIEDAMNYFQKLSAEEILIWFVRAKIDKTKTVWEDLGSLKELLETAPFNTRTYDVKVLYESICKRAVKKLVSGKGSELEFDHTRGKKKIRGSKENLSNFDIIQKKKYNARKGRTI